MFTPGTFSDQTNPPQQTTSTSNSSATTMPLPSQSTLPLTLILAATPKLGIGHLGQLPWPSLKTEMGYFARVTKRVPSLSSPTSSSSEAQSSQRKRINAVIMGRKTWDSIPEKFRPLKGRLNVVVTRDGENARWKRQGDEVDEGPLVVRSLEDAVENIRRRNGDSGLALHGGSTSREPEIARIFVIGGASLYEAALGLRDTERVLLTKIHTEYECDTFFPLDLEGEEGKKGGWRRCEKSELEKWVGEEVQGVVEEKGVRFEFCMFEKGR